MGPICEYQNTKTELAKCMSTSRKKTLETVMACALNRSEPRLWAGNNSSHTRNCRADVKACHGRALSLSRVLASSAALRRPGGPGNHTVWRGGASATQSHSGNVERLVE